MYIESGMNKRAEINACNALKENIRMAPLKSHVVSSLLPRPRPTLQHQPVSLPRTAAATGVKDVTLISIGVIRRQPLASAQWAMRRFNGTPRRLSTATKQSRSSSPQ